MHLIYADAVADYVTSVPWFQEWPECRQVLLGRLSAEPSWLLALPGVSCLAVGGVPDAAVPVTAASVALWQAASIFDAVQDGDDVLALGFNSSATAIGLATGLVFAAFQFLDSVQTYPGAARRLVALFSEIAFRSTLGQYLGLVQNYEDMPVTGALEAYWRMVISKSGSLIQLATAGGAAAGTNSEHLIAALSEFGNALGVILQILDDCRDVLIGSDITDCEVSLPLLLFFMAAQDDCLERQLKDIPSSATLLSKETLFDLLREADVPDIITDVLLDWRQRALNSLRPLKSSEAVDALKGIMEHVLRPSPSSG